VARELVAPWALRAVTKPVAAALFTWLGAPQWPLVVGSAPAMERSAPPQQQDLRTRQRR